VSDIAFPTPDPGILARRDAIVAGLAALVPANSLITSENERRAFETDALTAYRRLPLAVVLPRTTEEVAAVLQFCHAEGVKIVPRGAGTSLSGGAIPQEDAVVVGLAKMNRILAIDFADRTMRVEAGVTNLAMTEAIMAEGFFYAPDPSSQLACTIAGNIAMNSGGAHCLKYGVTTNHVIGVRMVLIDGTIVDIGGEQADSAGLDLLGLVIGSEGQLGIVTEAIVRILPSAEGARPVLFGFETSAAAGAAVAAIIAAGIVPVAMEFMDRPAIAICEAFAHAGYPLDAGAMLIIEVEGSDAEMEAELARIIDIARRHGVKTIRESKSAMETALIWKGRKSAFGATGRLADYVCMDGTIPTGRLPEALERIAAIVARHRLRVANVFHAGDGNLHPLVLYDCNDASERAEAEAAGAEILQLCVELGGCLTGEHGVGIEKRELMTCQFSRADLEQQMRVRAVFDADWLLNPAKVFPLDGRVAA
jgi:glycolate oxidase